MMTLFSPIAGRLSDRIDPRMVASIGMGITAVGLSLFIFLDEGSTIASIIAVLILNGFGFALFSSPNANTIMNSVEKRFYGVASGTVGSRRTLGMMISMSIATLIFTILIGRVQITVEYYPVFLRSVRVAFIIFAGLCVAGIFFSLARGRSQIPASETPGAHA